MSDPNQYPLFEYDMEDPEEYQVLRATITIEFGERHFNYMVMNTPSTIAENAEHPGEFMITYSPMRAREDLSQWMGQCLAAVPSEGTS